MIVWKLVPGTEHCFASTNGEVRGALDYRISLHSGRCQVQVKRKGYKKRTKWFSVEHVVLLTFKGERLRTHPYCCHKNDIRTDNRLSNLYYGTRSSNRQDAMRNGRFDFAGMWERRKEKYGKAGTKDVKRKLRRIKLAWRKRVEIYGKRGRRWTTEQQIEATKKAWRTRKERYGPSGIRRNQCQSI